MALNTLKCNPLTPLHFKGLSGGEEDFPKVCGGMLNSCATSSQLMFTCCNSLLIPCEFIIVHKS